MFSHPRIWRLFLVSLITIAFGAQSGHGEELRRHGETRLDNEEQLQAWDAQAAR